MSATKDQRPAVDPAATEPVAASSPVATSPAPAFVPDDKTPVRFTRTFSRFHRGDVAGFPESYAQQLITKGVAVLWQPPQSRAVNEMVRK